MCRLFTCNLLELPFISTIVAKKPKNPGLNGIRTHDLVITGAVTLSSAEAPVSKPQPPRVSTQRDCRRPLRRREVQ